MREQYAFISRHEPTWAQQKLAHAQGIDLVWIGDLDGFTVTAQAVIEAYDRRQSEYRDTCGNDDFQWGWPTCTGVVVVHAGAALRLLPHFNVGVFSNTNRAPEGEKPSYEAGALHIWQKDEGQQAGFNRGWSWANQEA